MDEGAVTTAAQERCTKPSALTVVKNVKFHSSRQKAAPSTAGTVIRTIDHQEDGSKLVHRF